MHVTKRGHVLNAVELYSHPSKRAAFHTIHAALALTPNAPVKYAPESDHTHNAGEHFDQGRSGSCGGHAVAKWARTCLAISCVPLTFSGDISPRLTYAESRCPSQPGTGPLKDTGVEPADPITALATEGVAPKQCATTPDGRNSDIWTAADLNAANLSSPPANDGDRPTPAELALAAKDLLVGAYAINPGAPNFVALVAASLSANLPVVATIFVDTVFEDWGVVDNPDGTTSLPAIDKAPLDGVPNFQDPQGGGHYITILAHKTLPDGRLAFLIWNSWGNTWGVASGNNPDVGNIWVTQDWLLASCSEAYAGKITRKA